MRVLVACETCFGNTGLAAQAVAEGLRSAVPDADVDIVAVARAGPGVAAGADLLVVAAPTHTFGLSRPGSRRAAREMGAAAVTSGPGMREWLRSLAAVDVPGRVATVEPMARSGVHGRQRSSGHRSSGHHRSGARHDRAGGPRRRSRKPRAPSRAGPKACGVR